MFKDTGISHTKNFISDDIKDSLNEEIDELSKNYLINGLTRASTWINHNLCYINDPIVNFNSVNLLEIIFKAHQELVKVNLNNYTLSFIRVFIEKKNSAPNAKIHTDNKPGIIRVLIYLKGGDKDNGNLNYIKGTHNSVYKQTIHKNGSAFVNPDELDLEDKITSMDTKEGDLILFDINGLHSKNPVKKERRVIYLEFHDGKSDNKMGKVILDNSKFTKNIMKNLDFLLSNNNTSHKDYENIKYQHHLPPQTPLRIFNYYFKIFCKLIVNRIKGKIK